MGTQPGDYLDQLERFVRDERLESVVFVEKTPDVYEYFRMSDVFVCASRNESLPLVVLEAMAFGLPIVSTDVFGVPEAVAHEREALLVGPGDAAALAAGVRRVLGDPPLAARLGATRPRDPRRAVHARADDRRVRPADGGVRLPVKPWRAGLHRRARTAARRLLLAAPMPRRLREALWHLGRRIPPPPGSLVARSDPDSADAYAAWLAQHAFDPAAARARLEGLRARPSFSIILPVHDPEPDDLERALASVDQQVYPDWELCIADDASTSARSARSWPTSSGGPPGPARPPRGGGQHIDGASNAALALARGEFLAFLDHDDELTPDALLEVAALLQDDPGADLVYSDHDVLGEDGRRHARFKPDWCPELLLSYMYLGHLKVYRTELVGPSGAAARVRGLGRLRPRAAPGRADRPDPPRAAHPLSLARRPGSMARATRAKPQSVEAGRRAVQEAVDRRGIAGTARQPDFARQARVGI